MKLRTWFLILSLLGLSTSIFSPPSYSWERKDVVEEVPLLADLPDPQMYTVIKNAIGGRKQVFRRSLKRLGNNTIEIQAVISAEGSFKYAPKILANVKQFPEWALDNINVNSTGSDYHFQIIGATVEPKDDSILGFSFKLQVPVLSYQGSRQFKTKSVARKDVFILEGDSLPANDSVVESVNLFMRVYPADNDPNQIWIAAFGKVVLRSWLLYEALPERLVTRESAERFQTLLSNYLHREDKIRTKEEKLDSAGG